MVINDNWVETNEVCPNCGSKVGFNKIETNSTIVLKCKSCGHKISYSNKTAPDYAEYQTQRRIISTQFDEWGDEDVVKEHVKDGLNLLKELKNSKVDKYDLDPMIVLLKIKLFSNNFKEVDDKVYEYIIKYQGATFLCLEDMLVSKSYTNQIAYLLKLQEEKKNEKINKIQKKKKLIKRLITTFMLLLIVAGIGYGAYYQGYLASWGGIFQREFTLTYKLEESGEEKTATVVQGLIYIT